MSIKDEGFPKNPSRHLSPEGDDFGSLLELVDDVRCEHPLVLESAGPDKAFAGGYSLAAPGFLAAEGMIPAQLKPADDILPEVVLDGAGEGENFVRIGRSEHARK